MSIETWLREADPARRADAPGPDSEIGRSIYERSVAGHEFTRADHRRTSSRPRLVRVSLLATVPVAIAILLAVTLLPGTEAPLPSAAATTFHRLSLVATTVPTTLGSGQYYYTEVERPTYQIAVGTTPGHAFNEYLDGTVQTWVAADGSGRVVTTTDPTPQFWTAADRAAWVASGRPPAAVPPDQLTTVEQLGPNSGSEVNGPIPLYDVSGLPTDPNALAQVLSHGEKPGNNLASLPKGISSLDFVSNCATRACALFERAVSLLQGPDVGATAAFRAALYQVLATVPGVTLLGPTTNPGGRSGIGLAYVEHRPASTVTVACDVAIGGTLHLASPPGGASVHLTPAPHNDTSTTKITYTVPASTTTFTVVIDPQSATVLGSEESFSPTLIPNRPVCGADSGHAVKATPPEHELTPTWHVVLAQGIVDSETALPQGS